MPYFGEQDRSGIDFSVYSSDEEESEIEELADDDCILAILRKHGTSDEVIDSLSQGLNFSSEMIKKRLEERVEGGDRRKMGHTPTIIITTQV